MQWQSTCRRVITWPDTGLRKPPESSIIVTHAIPRQVCLVLHLQVLLRTAYRNPEGIAEAVRALRALGLKPSATGRATISIATDVATAATMFGPLNAPPSDKGLDSSHPLGQALAIPAALVRIVESITVAPQHILFKNTDTTSRDDA